LVAIEILYRLLIVTFALGRKATMHNATDDRLWHRQTKHCSIPGKRDR